MKITMEMSLYNFETWGGAVDTLERIKEADLCDELEEYLEGLYPDGISETTLNDILWFDADSILEALGLSTDDVVVYE